MIILPRTSTFEAWITEAARHNLVIERWIIDDQAGEFKLTAVIRSLSGEPIQFDDEVQNSMAKQPAEPTNGKAHRSKLAQALSELHSLAAQNISQPQRIELPGGLRIDVIVSADGNTRILLARQSVYPSDTEFSTVLAHWPYDPPGDILPEKFEHQAKSGHWYCLRAAWQTPIKPQKRTPIEEDANAIIQ